MTQSNAKMNTPLLKIYKFARPSEDGKSFTWEDAQEEIWKWEAYYKDGIVLKQFDDHGRFHQFKEIDQTKLRFFKMKCALPEIATIFTLDFDPRYMKLIHGYRRFHLVDTISNDYFQQAHGDFKLYFFGYESKAYMKDGASFKEVNKQTINFIMPNGELITTDDRNKVKF